MIEERSKNVIESKFENSQEEKYENVLKEERKSRALRVQEKKVKAKEWVAILFDSFVNTYGDKWIARLKESDPEALFNMWSSCLTDLYDHEFRQGLEDYAKMFRFPPTIADFFKAAGVDAEKRTKEIRHFANAY